jgi:hypothetical protein
MVEQRRSANATNLNTSVDSSLEMNVKLPVDIGKDCGTIGATARVGLRLSRLHLRARYYISTFNRQLGCRTTLEMGFCAGGCCDCRSAFYLCNMRRV